MERIHNNFIPSVIDESEHWFLGDGCSPANILMPNGHGWGDFMPKGEIQSRGNFDSTNCTNYSKYNCVEALGKKKFGAEFQNNLAERHAGIVSNTTTSGNTLQNVCEALRLYGAIPEAFLPFDENINTWAKYYSPKPIPFDLWKVAESWRRKYTYNHDWVFLPSDTREIKIAKMKEALKYSPLSVAGYAWSRHEDGLYYHDQPYDNHAFDVFDYVEGKYWLALDSYSDETGSFIKKLEWNYAFREAKRHSLEKSLGSNSGKVPTYIEYLGYRIKYYLADILK